MTNREIAERTDPDELLVDAIEASYRRIIAKAHEGLEALERISE